MLSHLNKTKTSIHLELFPEIPEQWNDDLINERWRLIQTIRKSLTEALETDRIAKNIGSSLEAVVYLYTTESSIISILSSIDMAEIAIVSKVEIINSLPPQGVIINERTNIGLQIKRACGTKCERCWKIDEKVKLCKTSLYGDANLCLRCLDIILHEKNHDER
jgi:isoleucyl-tRNA synthetase